MIDLTPWQWLALGIGAIGAGLSKTGIPGLGMLPVVLFALVLGDVRRSAGTLLPLLCIADAVGLVMWRRHAQAARLFELAPWVAGGIVVAMLVLGLPQRPLELLVGSIVVAMALLQIRRRLNDGATATDQVSVPPAPWSTAGHGLLAGFASTIANAAGPVMSLYLLGRRLPKAEMLAIGAWFFFLINLTKLPVYATQPILGHPAMIDGATLAMTGILAPFTFVGALLGWVIGKRIPQRLFDWSVLVLALLGGIGILIGAGAWAAHAGR